MARWRVCRLHVCTFTLVALVLLPAPASAQPATVSITNAPSFADRNSSYTITVTANAAPFVSATVSLAANFPDVTFSQQAWSFSCGVGSCSSSRVITVFTGNTGGRNLTITAGAMAGGSTSTALANTWIRGSSAFGSSSLEVPTLHTRTITVTLQTMPPMGVTIQLIKSGPAAAASAVPSAVTVSPGTTSTSFPITTGAASGALTISATTGSLFYTAPAPITFTVLNPTEAPTPAGTNVTVVPPLPAGGSVPVRVTFAQVTNAGSTALTNVVAPVAPPSGWEHPGAPLSFQLQTTASTSGIVTVCATYPNGVAPDETGLRLFALTSDGWDDTTAHIDTSANQICGEVAAIAHAIFAIFRLNTAPDVGPISGPESVVAAGVTQSFSATFTDPDVTDAHTGTWFWGDGTTSPAVISNVSGTLTARGEYAFGAGTHLVRLVISDGGQPAASDAFEVIADGSAPAITAISASPGSIWPPDSKMKDVIVSVTATDDTATPVCRITSVLADAQNPKQTAFVISGPLTLQVKAFPHAAYVITVTCTDAIGQTSTAQTRVVVAK